jgi:hypothetical protein
MAQSEQTYANHVRNFPLFHFFAFPVLALNFLWSAWQAFTGPSVASVWGVIVAAALVGALLASRLMALAVQDRVIRLEMRLRLREVLPADLQSRAPDLTRGQLVGLRFASDGELPDLVRQVLAGTFKTATDIKKAVKHWQGDHLRA